MIGNCKFKNGVAMLTGADGGIGKAFINELLKRGISKIYITGINIDALKELKKIAPDILFPIRLDVTKSEDIQECLAQSSDTTILINNAGVELKKSFIDEKAADCARFEMNINFIGVVDLCNHYLPTLKKNNNSSIINILSIGSLAISKKISTYCASKMAAHVFTKCIREEVQDEVNVIGVYPGYVDTSMVSDIQNEKISPDVLVKNICDEIEKGKLEVFPDPMSMEYSNSSKLILDKF